MADLFKLVLVVAFILFLVVIGPLATIWALNTLFPVLAISYAIDTWFAVVIIGSLLKTTVKVRK